MHLPDFEQTLGQRAGLVENHGIDPRNGIQITAALKEHAGLRSNADTAEIAQRNTDNQRTRTRGHQKYQGPGQPFVERIGEASVQERPQSGQSDDQHGQSRHYGSINPGETADEQFGGSLARRSFFDHGENPRKGALPIRARHFDPDRLQRRDHTRQHLFSLTDRPRRTLSGQRRRIERGRLGQQNAVQRDTSPRKHLDRPARHDLRSGHSHRFPFHQNVRLFGPDIDERTNIPPRPLHGTLLQRLSDRIEQHHGNPLGILSDIESTDGSEAHQRIFRKEIPLPHTVPCLPEHRKPYRKISREVPAEPYCGRCEKFDTGILHDESCRKQHGRRNGPPIALRMMVMVRTCIASGAAATIRLTFHNAFILLWCQI